MCEVIVEDLVGRFEKPPELREVLADALDVVADGVIVVDAEQRVVFFNRAAELIFGYSAAEVVGGSLGRLLPSGFASAHHARLQAFAASGEVTRAMGLSGKVQGLRKDGGQFPVEATISRLGRPGEQLFMVIIRDVTERRRGEDALRESEERYRSIVAAMEEGIALQDASGQIRACNASAERILGLTADQMMGRTSVDPRWRAVREDGSPFPGDEHPAMVTLRTGKPLSNVLMGVHKPEGELAWISVNSQPLFGQGGPLPSGVVTSFTDITERRRAEQDLRESEERYRSLWDNSLDGILLTTPDGTVRAANPAACAILGRSEEEICGAGRHHLLDPSDPRVAGGLKERARTGVFRGELNFLRLDGTPLPCDVSSSLFKDSEGRDRGIVVFRDITARKRAESALVQHEALLRRILEILPVGVWIVDREGRVLSGNEAGRALWAGARYVGVEGYGEYKAWWPDSGVPVRSEEWAAVRAVQRGESVLDEVMNIETFDGRGKTILNSAIPIRDAGGDITGAIVVNQDITERVQAYQLLEQRVEERTRELSALLEVSRDVAAMLDLAPLLREILTHLKTVIEYTGAGIAIKVDDATLRMLDYDGPIPREQMLVDIPLEPESGYKDVVRCGEPVVLDDIWDESPQMREIREDWDPQQLSAVAGVRSWLGVPLIAKGRLIGVLRLDHAEVGHFTPEHARLALAFADQAAVAIENARLYEQAQGIAALEERQRLARDLHDSVSQALYGMTLGARTARALVQDDPGRATEALDYVLSLAEAAFAEMRAVIFDLRPDSVEKEGLVCALGWQADLLRIRHQVEVETEFCEEPNLPIAVKDALYRIAREAANNIAKHAGARHVRLRLEHRPGFTGLEIADDGAGFLPTGTYPGHLGLRAMRERAAAIGAGLEVESSPGAGTRIRVHLK
jgi:PAS domain S-box-containing protein